MDAYSRVRGQIAIAASLGTPTEIQFVLKPQPIDRGRVRATVGTNCGDPVVLGLGHALGHVRPGKEPLLISGNPVAWHVRAARRRTSLVVGFLRRLFLSWHS